MVADPLEGLLQLVPARLRVVGQDLVDLPVSLAVDADLSAGVEGLENADEGVAPGHEVDR